MSFPNHPQIKAKETQIDLHKNKTTAVQRICDFVSGFSYLGLHLWSNVIINSKEPNSNSVKTPASLMVWGCISAYGVGSLDILKGTMNAERYIKIVSATYAPLQRTCISAGQCKTTYCSYHNSTAS